MSKNILICLRIFAVCLASSAIFLAITDHYTLISNEANAQQCRQVIPTGYLTITSFPLQSCVAFPLSYPTCSVPGYPRSVVTFMQRADNLPQGGCYTYRICSQI